MSNDLSLPHRRLEHGVMNHHRDQNRRRNERKSAKFALRPHQNPSHSLKDIQIDDFPKERKYIGNEAQRSDLQEPNQQSLPIVHKERVLRRRAVLLQQLRRGAEQHGLRAHAGHPHQHFNEHAPAAIAEIGHDVVPDVPVVRGVAARREHDGAGNGEEHVHGAHAQDALHGHAERLRLLRASHLLLAVRGKREKGT